MEHSIPLGRVAGVPVRASWSLLVVFALVTWGLAGVILPDAAPDAATGAYVAAAVVAAFGFFGGLLAHELAHALVARRAGIEVEDITLWLFGGMSRLKSEPPSPADELRIAAAGPLVSLVLGTLVLATAVPAAVVAGDLVTAALVWLGVATLVLGAFNLLPAFPLDGGRVARALLWRSTGDAGDATHRVARAGRWLGWGLVVLGLLGSGVGGLWLALIGWIVVVDSRLEDERAHAREVLGTINAEDVMTVDPITVPSGTTVERWLEDYVVPYRCSAFPVLDPTGRPVGVVTLAAARRAVAESRAITTVDDIAEPGGSVPTARRDTPLIDLVALAGPRRRRVLVMDGPTVVGIVTATDIDRTQEIVELAHHL